MTLFPVMLASPSRAENSLEATPTPPWLAEFRAHRHQVTESTSSPASTGTSRLSELGAVVSRSWSYSPSFDVSVGLALDYGFGESPTHRRTHVFLAPQFSVAYIQERSRWRVSYEPLLWGEETLTASMIDTRRRDWKGHRVRISWLAQLGADRTLHFGPTLSYESRRSSEEQIGSQPPTNLAAEATSWRPGVGAVLAF